jgi:hypothetical protein
MKYKNIAAHLYKDKELSTRTTVAIVAGVSIGLAIGALFATKKGREMKDRLLEFASDLVDQVSGNTRIKAQKKLGNLIEDVRMHVKQNAEGLGG